MAKLNGSNCFSVVFNCYLLLVLFSDFQKTHIDKGLEQYLAFHLIDTNRQFDCQSILADVFDDLCLIF